MKVDGFGVQHREGCPRPMWASTPHEGQICQGCKVRWRLGDAAGPARRASGFTSDEREEPRA